jgi:hypothetical protein
MVSHDRDVQGVDRCRLGIQHELVGNVLVLWLEMEAVVPVRVALEGPR